MSVSLVKVPRERGPFDGYARVHGGYGRTTADRARARRPFLAAVVVSTVVGLGAAGVGAVAVAEVRSSDFAACVSRVAWIPADEIPAGYVSTGRFAQYAPATCVREFGAARLAAAGQ